MHPLRLAEVTAYVETNIKEFHEARINKIRDLSLDEVLKRKSGKNHDNVSCRSWLSRAIFGYVGLSLQIEENIPVYP